MWICENCGIGNYDSSSFCGQCGAKKPERIPKPLPAEKPAPSQKNSSVVTGLLIAAVALLAVIALMVSNRNDESSAAPSPRSEEPAVSSYSDPLSCADIGSSVLFGRFEQDGNTANGTENIEWTVLAREDGRVLLISRYILARIVYDGPGATFTDTPSWYDSAVRQWLNKTFINSAFNAEERGRIATVTVTNDVRDSQDKAFLLNETEARWYFSSNAARMSWPTESAYDNTQSHYFSDDEEYERQMMEAGTCAWLLRAQGDFSYCASYVDDSGEIGNAYGNGLSEYINGVRPVIWVYTD